MDVENEESEDFQVRKVRDSLEACKRKRRRRRSKHKCRKSRRKARKCRKKRRRCSKKRIRRCVRSVSHEPKQWKEGGKSFDSCRHYVNLPPWVVKELEVILKIMKNDDIKQQDQQNRGAERQDDMGIQDQQSHIPAQHSAKMS